MLTDSQYELVREGIDEEDGTVEDRVVETYYCPLTAVEDRKTFLCFIGDNGGIDVEIRVPVELLEANGWRRASSGEAAGG